MKKLNQYILEKFKINKDIKVVEDNMIDFLLAYFDKMILVDKERKTISEHIIQIAEDWKKENDINLTYIYITDIDEKSLKNKDKCKELGYKVLNKKVFDYKITLDINTEGEKQYQNKLENQVVNIKIYTTKNTFLYIDSFVKSSGIAFSKIKI